MAASSMLAMVLVCATLAGASCIRSFDNAAVLMQQESSGHTGSLARAEEDAAAVDASAAPDENDTGFAIWEASKVPDGPAALPPERPPLACEISPLTGACLPAFMVIGVQKSGTSTLFQILKGHHQIQPPAQKELLWFAEGTAGRNRCHPPATKPTDGEFESYLRASFPSAPRSLDTDVLSCEFSASYFHCWCCPAAFRRLMPNLRLVVQLRDPIERAISRWSEQHFGINGGVVETLGSFEELVEKDLPSLQACLDGQPSSETQVYCAASHNILGLSLYDAALKSWHSHFKPEDVLVTYLDQLAAEPQSVMSAIHRHLGIRDIKYDPEVVHRTYNSMGNYGWEDYRHKAIGANRTTMQRLYQFYRPHMQQLQAMEKKGLISPLPASWIARWDL